MDDAFTEGSFLHLRGVRVPVGPRGVLLLTKATVALAGKREAGLPELRLHAFEGALTFGEEGFSADVHFTAVPDPDARAWVAGDLSITNATWAGTAPGRPRRGPMSGSARLFVTSQEARLEDGRLESQSQDEGGPVADVRFTAEGTPDPATLRRARISLPKARVGAFVDAVRAVTGRPLEIPPGVPPDAGLDGEITWDEHTGGTCKLHTSTDGLRATVEGTVDANGGSLRGRIEADVAPALPMYAARVPAPLVPRDEDVLHLALDLGGDVKRPVVNGTLAGPSVSFRFGRPRFCPLLTLAGVHADIAIADDVARIRARAKASSAPIQASLDLPLRAARGRRVTGRVENIEAIWLTAIATALGVEGVKLEGDHALDAEDVAAPWLVPRDAKTTAAVTFEHDGAEAKISATVKVATAASHLALEPVAIAGDRITGGRFHGSLDVAEALKIGLFPFAVRPRPDGAIRIDVALEGPLASPTARGRIGAPRIDLVVPSVPALPPVPCTDVDARLVVTLAPPSEGGSVRATIDAMRFRALGGAFGLEAHLGFGAEARPLFVEVKDADARFIEGLGAFVRGQQGGRFAVEREGTRPRGPEGERWIPRSARLSGTLELRRKSVVAALGVETDAGTRFVVDLKVLDGSPTGTKVRGTLALADARLLGAFDELPVRVIPEGRAHVDALVAERAKEVTLTGYIVSDRVALASRASDAVPVVVLEDLVVPFRHVVVPAGTRARVSKTVWRDAEARLYDGVVSTTGAALPDGTLRASVRASGVAVERFPTERSGKPLGASVCGRLALELDVVKVASSALTGRGRAQLDDPSYPVIALSAPSLKRYGLPAPEATGVSPATTTIAIDAWGIAFRHVHAEVPGIHADGDITVRTDGSTDGAFVVTLGPAYLASSPLLSLPSAFAETLTLPVRIVGPLARPKIDADLTTCLGRFVTENRVTDIVTDAAEGVVSLFTGRDPPSVPERTSSHPSAPRPAAPTEPTAPDAILAGLVGDEPRWREIDGRIAAAGITRRTRRYRVG